MDTESHYSLLRDKLDALGFHQPLPIGSLAIVSALLNDLVLTTKNFKDAKTQINQLNKEKTAWQLGVEPYKCDNSKLLAECNGLHLELMKQRDAFETQINDFKKTIRDLQLDKQYLDEQCVELRNTVAELEQMIDDPRYKKNRTNKAVQKRKPFISTVRSGDFPALPPLPAKGDDRSSHFGKCSHSTRKECQCLAAEYEHNNVQNQLELIALYKQQLERRNNEISRLNRLLIGGRPVTALAKDCCFDGVGSLSRDIDAMQMEMSELQQRFDEAIQNQHEAEKRAISLKAENDAMANELRELREVALGVETDANSALGTLRQQNNQLKTKLYESKKFIRELEAKMDKMKKRNEYANSQVRSLQSIIERTGGKEEDLKSMVTKLSKQIEQLKTEKTHSTNSIKEKIDVGTMTQRPSMNDESIDVSRLKADREFYQREYLKLKSLQFKFNEHEQRRMSKCPTFGMGHVDVVCGTERPISVHQYYPNCECLANIRHCTKANIRCDHEHRHIEQLKQKIRELESEIKSLHAANVPNKAMSNLLKDELTQLRRQIDDLTAENNRLQTSYNQLKILQKRTESNLIDHESQLKHHAWQLNHAESQLTINESSRRDVCHEIRDLKSEVTRLTATNECLQKEKDRLVMQLDTKTEKIISLESKVEMLRDRLAHLNCQTDTASRDLESAHLEKQRCEDSVRKLTTETDTLRTQIDHLKRINENIMIENTRLTTELVDSECTSCLHKKKLIEAEKQVEQLKNQLQQYVQEVKRAEDLLLRKESERDEMLDLYKTLSQDALQLEENNHTLEIEVVERKRNLCDVEAKLSHVTLQLTRREHELSDANEKIAQLKQRIGEVERNADRYAAERDKAKRELEAMRELCSKMEIEKEKLNAEVNEYAEIRRELERDNDKLRNELMQKELCDEWNKTRTATE